MDSKQSERHALMLALCAVLLWSTVATGFKLGLAAMSVVQLLFSATAVSSCVFFVYALQQRQFHLTPHQAGQALMLGLLNPLAYYLVLLAAYERLPAHIAQPLNYTWAITLAILAVPILKQRLSPRALTGIVISYAGVVLLLSGDSGGPLNIPGVILALLSTLLWAAYWLLTTRTTAPAAATLFWGFSAALLPLGLLCFLGPGWPELSWSNVGYAVWVGGIEMGITFILWQLALRKTSQAGTLSQLIFLSPFLSMLLIHSVLGEHIGWRAIGGLCIIVLGIGVARLRQSEATRQ